MIVGSVCLSHSPLKDRNRADPATEARFEEALAEVGAFLVEHKPDLTILFYPDHLNGFFYRLLPPFCVGAQGASIGDYGTAAGRLGIPEDRATDLARSVLRAGVDTAISYDMQVDHGGVQPLEWLSESYPLFRVIPIFVNCAAPPLPTFERVRALGHAVGEWARAAPERILIIGSGGLSHDPPIPSLSTASSEVRERMVGGGATDHARRFTRQAQAHLEGSAMALGRSKLLPANAKWDRMMLNSFAAGELTLLDHATDTEITGAGGRGGHEVRTWIAALATLGAGYSATELFYEPIDQWITGMGILRATPARAAGSGPTL
jgi:2,3-dihydroxyphenylpropionate 1,2-dioxygenase